MAELRAFGTRVYYPRHFIVRGICSFMFPTRIWRHLLQFIQRALLATTHLDGNKRTAAVVAETFLEFNGCTLEASDDDWCARMLCLAAGESSEEQLATWLREHVRPAG